MQSIIAVEFSAKAGDRKFKEESVAFHNPEELFAFVAPGGGCDAISNEVDEIQMVFLQPEHANTKNPVGLSCKNARSIPHGHEPSLKKRI